jgi:WD40 repeat protein
MEFIMKKLLLSFLFLTGYQVQAAESHAAQAKQAAGPVVRLQLSDDTTTQVPRSFAGELSAVSNLLKDLPDLDELIPLPNKFVTREILQQLQHLAAMNTQAEVLAYLEQLSLLQLVHLYNANGFLELNREFIYNGEVKKLDALLFKRIIEQLEVVNLEEIDYKYLFEAINTNNNLKVYLTEALVKRRAWSVLQTLQGHAGPVSSAVFSPDGLLIVTASEDNTAKVWVTRTGQCIRTLQGHTRPVSSAEFSPDGLLIVTASLDDTARIWDVQTGVCVRTLQGHTDRVNLAAFSPNGLLIATASDDHTTRLWDTRTGECVRTLQGHTNIVKSAVFSSDGELIATASYDETAKVWDAQTGVCVRTLQGHTNIVNSVAFSRNGLLIVTASDDLTAKIWDTQTGACVRTLQGHTDRVNLAAFSSNGLLIATASDDHTTRLWDTRTGECVCTLQEHTNWVNSVAFSRDGLWLATASWDNTAKVWANNFTKVGLTLEQALDLPIEDVIHVARTGEIPISKIQASEPEEPVQEEDSFAPAGPADTVVHQEVKKK